MHSSVSLDRWSKTQLQYDDLSKILIGFDHNLILKLLASFDFYEDIETLRLDVRSKFGDVKFTLTNSMDLKDLVKFGVWFLQG